MKQTKTIEARIEKHKASITKFKSDTTLNASEKKRVIYTLQCLVRQLKWVLDN